MIVWMIYQAVDAKKNEWYIKEHQAIGKKLGIEIELKLVEDLSIGVKESGYYITDQKEIVEAPKAAIVRTIWPLLSEHLEAMGTRVFNPAQIAGLCNDKARTYREIAKLQIPLIPTQFCKKENLNQKVMEQEKPCIVKSVDGHGGSEVFLLEEANVTEVLSQIHSLQANHFVIQPYLKGRSQDLRVYVLGKEILGCVLRTAKDSFKSNFSLGGLVSAYQLTETENAVVHQIIDAYPFDLVGIDFLRQEDGSLVFNEIEDVVGARMLYQTSNLNLVESYLLYISNILGKMLE